MMFTKFGGDIIYQDIKLRLNMSLRSTWQNRISENHKVDIYEGKIGTFRQTVLDPK